MVKSTRSPFHYPALLDPALLDPDAASCEAAKERLLRRLQWRLLPLLAMGYGFGLMDRANIGFAELTMADELCLSASDFGLASGIFFCSYCAWAIPSNYLLSRVGARSVLSACLLSWGLLSTSLGFIRSSWQLYTIRFLLGFAESGFYPGALLYLSHWFPDRAIGKASTIFGLGGSVGAAVGSFTSGFILDYVGGGAWAGWRFLFFIQGAPSVLLGLAALLLLPDGPSSAWWLSGEERRLLATMFAPGAAHTGGAPPPALSMQQAGPVPPLDTSPPWAQVPNMAAAPFPTPHETTPGAEERAHARNPQPGGPQPGGPSLIQPGREGPSLLQPVVALPLGESLPLVLRRWPTYIFGLHHYMAATIFYVILFFMPMLWHELLPEWQYYRLSLMISLPTVIGIVIGPRIATWGDGTDPHSNSRKRWVLVFVVNTLAALIFTLAGVCLLVASDPHLAHSTRHMLSLSALILLSTTVPLASGSSGAMWALHHGMTPSELRPISIAVVNAIGNLGGFAGAD